MKLFLLHTRNQSNTPFVSREWQVGPIIPLTHSTEIMGSYGRHAVHSMPGVHVIYIFCQGCTLAPVHMWWRIGRGKKNKKNKIHSTTANMCFTDRASIWCGGRIWKMNCHHWTPWDGCDFSLLQSVWQLLLTHTHTHTHPKLTWLVHMHGSYWHLLTPRETNWYDLLKQWFMFLPRRFTSHRRGETSGQRKNKKILLRPVALDVTIYGVNFKSCRGNRLRNGRLGSVASNSITV